MTKFAWTLACSKFSKPTDASLVGDGAVKDWVVEAIEGACITAFKDAANAFSSLTVVRIL